MSISSKYPSVRPTKVINLSKETLLNSSVEYSRGGVGTYVDENGLIVSAAPDQPRFNHDPETLEYKGLLVEESRTNLVAESVPTTFGYYWWSTIGGTDSPNATLAPDNTFTAGKFTYDGFSTDVRQYIPWVDNLSAGTTYIGSIFLKSINATIFSIGKTGASNISGTIGGGFGATFDLSAGTATSSTTDVWIEPYPNGWYKCSFAFVANVANAIAYIIIYPGAGRDFYFWGGQIEAGSFPTSYIPTSGSAVTRPADSFSVPLPGSVVKSGRVGFTPEQSLNTYAPSFALKDSALPAKPYVLELGSANSAPVASVVYNSVRQGTTSIPALPATAPSLKSTLSFNFEPTTGAVEISSTASDDADSHVLALPAELSRPVPSDQTLDLLEVNGGGGSINLREIYLWEAALSTEQLASVSGELKSIGQPIELSTGVNKNSDYADAGARPTLDLRFAERKDLFDDTTEQNLVTFSRGSIGTYVDENGIVQTAVADEPRFDHDPTTGESLGLLVEEARTNLRTYSTIPTTEFADPTGSRATIIPSAEITPDGTISGVQISNDTGVDDQRCWGYFTDYVSVPTTGYICASVFVKMINGTEIEVKGDEGNQGWIGFAGVRVNFSTETPTVTLLGASGQNAKGGGAIPYPNGWWRIWYYIDTADGFNNGQTRAPGVVPRIAGTSACIWGAQLEAGSFPTSYIPTPATFTSRSTTATYYDANGVIQTAAVNVARDNAYLPDENGVMRPAGLLLESVGTNLLTYSEQFDQWVNSGGATVTVNAAEAPDGTFTADRTSFSGAPYIYLSGAALTLNPSTTYTTSVYVKDNGTDLYTQELDDKGFAGLRYRTQFVFSTKTLTTSGTGAGSMAPPVYKEVGNGWFRIIQTITVQATATSLVFMFRYGTQDNFLWGAQLEQGSYATSYIPTSGSQGIREPDISSSAEGIRQPDVASITGTDFSSWYNQSEGTIFGDYGWTVTTRNIVSNAVGTGNNGNNGLLRQIGTTVTIPRVKHAIGLTNFSVGNTASPANQICYVNGSVSGTGASIFFPTYPSDLQIGRQQASGALNGYIARITYWPTRLPDTTLQVLTDPAISTWDLVFDSSLSTDGTCAIITASTCTYTIDWGDGTPVQTINATGTGFEVTHRYTFPQTYKVKIDVLSGTFKPYYNNSAYADQLVEIRQTPDGWTNTSTSGFGTDLGNAWYGANNLRVVDRELNTSGVTNLAGAWHNCTNLATFPLLNTSSGTNFGSTWRYCTNLTSFPLIDTSNGTDFSAAWLGCNSLTEFPEIDTSSGSIFDYAWLSCTNLTEFPLLDVSSATRFLQAWGGCTNLTTFPANFFDGVTGPVTTNCFQNTWLGCSLTPTSVENILNSISVSAASSTPPAGKDITITYDATITPGPDITVPAIDLLAKGWTPKLNNVTPDPYALASLDLDFATNLSLTDNISGNNLITFSRGSDGTYVDSSGVIQIAGPDTPRFDHDPDTLESLGLLVEESSTNEWSNSESLIGGTNGYTLPGGLTNPAGGTTAVKIPAGSTQTWWNRGSAGFAVTSGDYWTMSWWAYSTNQSVNFGNSNYFSVANTTISQDITVSAGQWKRCYRTVQFTASGSPQIRFMPYTYTLYTDTNNEVFVWGFQFEKKAFPTSYIPTTGTALTRSRDEASITGSNFSSWYNNNEGTFFTDMALGFTNNAGNPFIFGGVYYTTVVESLRTLGNATICFGLSNSQTVPSKTAVGLKPGDYKVYRDGVLPPNSTSTNTYIPIGTQLLINPSLGSKGHIGRITYWPKRLTDTSLQYLTT